MTDVVNPKSASPDQLLPYHKKISAEGKALMICFISYTYMVLKAASKSRLLIMSIERFELSRLSTREPKSRASAKFRHMDKYIKSQ